MAHRTVLRFALLNAMIAATANAQAGGAGLLTYIPGSTVKVEQMIGDCDWQVQASKKTCTPTASRTATRYNILGNDVASSFEDNGKVIFLFGDTISRDVTAVNFHAHDPVAWSTVADGEAGLVLNFFTNADNTPLFVEPPGVAMGADDVPNAGISLSDGIYIVCNTGADTSLPNPQTNSYSLLAHFDEKTQIFTTGRTISPVGGRFLTTSMRASGPNVFLFGAGPYRGSDVYLQMTPAATFASGAGTQYFAGFVNGQPKWSNSEGDAVPVVEDNPLNGPAWPNDNPGVGNMSVTFSQTLSLWLMTYDGGRQSARTRGAYFTYAPQPWGPWATPQLIFNEARDNAYGVYIHNPAIMPDPPGDGLNGPTIGANDIYSTAGGDYAPLMIERFTTVAGNVLKIYFTMSTWNPYTVVKMRSEFTIGSLPAISKVANAEGQSPTLAPNTWADVQGANLAPAADTRVWDAADFANHQLPTQLDGVGVTVNGKPAYVYYISPTQINFLTPPDAIQGEVEVLVTSAGKSGNAVMAPAQTLSPSFFVFDGTHVAAVHLDGTFIGPPSLYPGMSFPAKPGETVVLYGNGFGATSNAVIAGSLTQSGILPTMPAMTVGGVPVTVTFAGLVSPGEYQFNVVLPANTPEGDDEVVAMYGGSATQAGAVLTVQH